MMKQNVNFRRAKSFNKQETVDLLYCESLQDCLEIDIDDSALLE